MLKKASSFRKAKVETQVSESISPLDLILALILFGFPHGGLVG
jgi:hypothetical protein